MKFNQVLLTAVAIGAVTAPNAQAAEKKPVKHHPGHAAESKDVVLKSEVEELKRQVAALRAEINAQRLSAPTAPTAPVELATGPSPAVQAAAAQQTASAAAAKADVAVAKAEAAQAAEAKVEKKLGAFAWAGDTKLGALIFANYSNINQQLNGVKQAPNGTGFNLKRAYLSVDHRFNDVFSANITTDVSNVIGETANNNYTTPTTSVAASTCATTAGKTAGTYTTTCTAPAAASLGTAAEVGKGLYLKYAFLQAKLDPALTIRAGSADTAWIGYMQGLYGHRYVENVLIDEYKLGQSADWGVAALGDLFGGHVSYQVGVVNGGGYRNVVVSKAVDIDGRISAQYAGFFGAVGGYEGYVGKALQGVVTDHRYRRGDAAVGFKNDKFTIGGEYVYAKNFNSITALTEDSTKGFSTFGHINLTPKWQVFGRYDWVRFIPSLGFPGSVSNHYFNGGLQFEPIKQLDLSLVYKRDLVRNLGAASGTIAEQNGTGTLGGAGNLSFGTYDEIGLFAQIKF